MSRSELVVCDGAEAFAQTAAERMAAVLALAVEERGRARVAISGGSTPGPAYRALANLGGFDRVDWYWVDDRCVPPDHARSNYAAARTDLFEPGRIEDSKVHRIRGELPPVAAANTYEALLRAHFGVAGDTKVDPDGRAPIELDLVVAGVGNDGHTASLFPGTGAVARSDTWVVAVEPGGDLEPRVSLSRPVLIAARRTLVLCRGAAKAPVVEAARQPGSEEEIPARLYLDARPGTVTWIIDRDAMPRTGDPLPPPSTE